MRMKKYIVFVLFLVLVMAGCGNENVVSNQGEEFQDVTNTNIGVNEETGDPHALLPFELPEYDGLYKDLPTQYPKPEIQPDEKFVIGFMNIFAANESLAAVEKAFIKEAERFGMEVITRDNQLDINKQISDMQQLIALGVDAIVYYPIDPNAIVQEVNRATEQGIPVFAQDQNFGVGQEAGGIVSQVWEGRDIQAFYAAAAVAKLHPGGNVLGISQGNPIPNLKFLMDRMEYYAEQMGLNWIGHRDSDTDNSVGGQKVMSQFLINNDNVDAVIAFNDSNAQGAYLALKERNMDDVVVVGINGDSEALGGIERGRQTVSIRSDMVGQGQQLVWGVYNHLTGQVSAEELPEVVVVPPKIMTKENLHMFDTYDNELKNIYGE